MCCSEHVRLELCLAILHALLSRLLLGDIVTINAGLTVASFLNHAHAMNCTVHVHLEVLITAYV